VRKRPNKFVRGQAVPYEDYGIIEILNSSGWFFMNGRLRHSAALRNMSLQSLRCVLRSGHIVRAVINPEYSEWVQVEANGGVWQ